MAWILWKAVPEQKALGVWVHGMGTVGGCGRARGSGNLGTWHGESGRRCRSSKLWESGCMAWRLWKAVGEQGALRQWARGRVAWGYLKAIDEGGPWESGGVILSMTALWVLPCIAKAGTKQMSSSLGPAVMSARILHGLCDSRGSAKWAK